MIKNIKIKNIINRHFLVFDLDGTIVDTDIANFLAYKDAIQQIIGLEIPISYSKYGRFTRENLLSVIDNLTNLQYKNIIDMKNILYKKYLPTTKVNSSLIKIINKYINTNKIILATNSYRDRAEVVLHHHGLNNIFDHMFFKENYKKENKFFHVANYFNVDANCIIAFKNENHEISKAISSGIPCCNIIKI